MEEDGGGEAAAGPEAERALEAFAGGSDAPQGYRTLVYVDNPVCYEPHKQEVMSVCAVSLLVETWLRLLFCSRILEHKC